MFSACTRLPRDAIQRARDAAEKIQRLVRAAHDALKRGVRPRGPRRPARGKTPLARAGSLAGAPRQARVLVGGARRRRLRRVSRRQAEAHLAKRVESALERRALRHRARERLGERARGRQRHRARDVRVRARVRGVEVRHRRQSLVDAACVVLRHREGVGEGVGERPGPGGWVLARARIPNLRGHARIRRRFRRRPGETSASGDPGTQNGGQRERVDSERRGAVSALGIRGHRGHRGRRGRRG